VTLVACLPTVGPKLVEEMNFPHVYARPLELGVAMRVNSWATHMRPDEVDVFNLYAPTAIESLSGSTVVIAARAAADEMYRSLKGSVAELHRVGDRVAPGDIGTAMLSVHRLGGEIGRA